MATPSTSINWAQKRVEEGVQALDQELKNAKRRAAAEQLKKGHGQLIKARDEWNAAVKRLNDSKAIVPEVLSELKALARRTEELRIQIAAQKLSAAMESQTSMSVTVTRGTAKSEVIPLEPDQSWEGQAEGKVRFELEDLQINVESGTGDVKALFTDLQAAEQRQTEILQELGMEDLVAVEAAEGRHKELVGEEKRLKDLYTVALQDRSEEEWASELAAAEALPPTRSEEALGAERNSAVGKKAKLDLEIGQEKEKVEKWTKEHENLDRLMAKILATTSELDAANKELKELPPLPDGFDSVSDYLAELSKKEGCRSEAEGTLRRLKIQQAELVGAAPKRTAEELREDLEFKEREFQRQVETGQGFLRIRSKLEEIVSQREDDDPMKGLETSVARHFNDLTSGRYESVRLDGATPVEVTGTLVLETAMLSQGTAGSLALATRLALAELYLDDMEGFLVLDDPFTDMDPERRRSAERCLGGFGEKCQVIFFTCHPDHAREVEELAGAKRPAIVE